VCSGPIDVNLREENFGKSLLDRKVFHLSVGARLLGAKLVAYQIGRGTPTQSIYIYIYIEIHTQQEREREGMYTGEPQHSQLVGTDHCGQLGEFSIVGGS
jgi:hypothetical protein